MHIMYCGVRVFYIQRLQTVVMSVYGQVCVDTRHYNNNNNNNNNNYTI